MRFLLPLLLALLVLVPGCADLPADAGHMPPPAVMPSYEALAERYNAHLAKLSQVWARAVVELTWVDEQGDRHVEQGDDSQLFLVRPDRMALSIGKVGQMGLWAGMDSERYWFFDLHDEQIAYVGRHVHAGKPCTEAPPLGMTPKQILDLLGLTPLPPQQGMAALVTWDRGAFRVLTPDQRRLLWLDPQTSLPTRIVLIGDREAAGRVVISARLSDYQRVEERDVPPNHQGQIPARIEITLPSGQGRLLVLLHRPIGDSSRIKPRLFDFETLVAVHKPKAIRELDAGCE